jgi:hypothetical protein
MANSEKTPTTFQELLVSCLASNDALAKLLIEKGIITEQEFLAKIAAERGVYQQMLDVRELEERIDVLTRSYAEKPDPRIIAELNELNRRVREMKEQ